MSPAGIEPATFRFVVQHLNHCDTAHYMNHQVKIHSSMLCQTVSLCVLFGSENKRRSFMCFVWISEQTAIISLYSINWLVCITEMESVYCAVRTGSLYIVQYRQFNIQQFYVLSTQRIYVFCVDLRTNSDYFPIQHWLGGLYNWDGVCLLCGTDWVFICNVGKFPRQY